MAIRLLIIILFGLMVFPTYGCSLVVRFAPYQLAAFEQNNGQWQNGDIILTQALLKEANCEHRFVAMPWARALNMLADGQIDMMSGVSKTPERQQFASFVGPQRSEQVILLSKQQHPVTLKQLYGLNWGAKPIAVQKGGYFGESFKQLLRRARRTQVQSKFMLLPNNDVKLNLLLKDRVAGVIGLKSNIDFQLSHRGEKLKSFQLAQEPVYTNPVYFAVSKKSQDQQVVERLRLAINRLKSNQTLAEPIE